MVNENCVGVTHVITSILNILVITCERPSQGCKLFGLSNGYLDVL